MKYVALLYNSSDHSLGPTILCENWGQAVDECIALAQRHGHIMTEEAMAAFADEHNGGDYCWDEADFSIHVGSLEEPYV